MNYFKILSIVLIFFAAFSCSDGSSNDDEFGEVSGTINFVGDWPSTGDVQVSIWSSWPPMGPPAKASVALTPGDNSQSYSLDGLSLGSYPVVTVGWRDPLNPAGAKVIGVYWSNTTTVGVDATGNVVVEPMGIVVEDGHMNHRNINIVADLNVIE